MKTRLWAVEIEGNDTTSMTYSVLAPTIEIAMRKAMKADKKNWGGDDVRVGRRQVISVNLDDADPVL